MQRITGIGLIVLVCLSMSGIAMAQPGGTPPGLEKRNTTVTAAAAAPPWENPERPDTWRLVGLTTVLVLAVLGTGAVGYHRYRDDGPVTVQSDEEQVLALLDAADGSVTQPDIRDETDWSASKVSRVTDRLEEDGKIEKLRLGRENVLRRA